MSKRGVTMIELLAAVVIFALTVSLAATVISLIENASDRIRLNTQANSQGLFLDNEIKDAFIKFGPTTYASCGTNCVTLEKEFIYEYDPILDEIVLTTYAPALTHEISISNGEILVNSVPIVIDYFTIGAGTQLEIIETSSQAYFLMTFELVAANGKIFTFTTSYSFAVLAIPA